MFEKVRKLIEEHDSIICLAHINPDGDAYGSQIGLRDAIRATYPNKKVYAVGSGLPEFFSLIGKMDQVDDETFKKSLVFLLDANEISRFEDKRCLTGHSTVLLDHHVQTRKFDFDFVHINDRACATVEILVPMLKELNFKIPETSATAMLLGLITDSGRFQFSFNHKITFETAAFLCSKGGQINQIYRILNIKNESDLLVRNFVFTNMKKTEDGVIYVGFDYCDCQRLGITPSRAANYVNLISNIKNYPIWIMYAFDDQGDAHFEFRSADYEIQPIAYKYGGGGHKHAAGCTAKKCSQETINNILRDLNKLIKRSN